MHPRNSKTPNLFIDPSISPSSITWSNVSLHAKVFVALASLFALCNRSPTTHAQDAPKNSKNEAILLSEFIYDSAPFPSCHASSIEETEQGLVATWFGGTHEKHPDVGIWISRLDHKPHSESTESKDSRVSDRWTTPIEVANGKQAGPQDTQLPTWNPVLFQPKTGPAPRPLYLFYKVGPSPETWWGMMTSSLDHGVTWSTPIRLPNGILGPIKNKPEELHDGSWLCPSSTETEEEPSKWTVHFELTSDRGKTWTRVPGLDQKPLNDGVSIQAIQPTLLQLGPQNWLAIGRSRQDKIFETQSLDDGKSWTPLRLGKLPNNNSGLDALTLRDGTHLLVYNHVSGTPGQWGGKRTPLNVAKSKDGREWTPWLVLEDTPGEFSYPAMIESADGLVHITYTWNRKKIKHVVISPKDGKLDRGLRD